MANAPRARNGSVLDGMFYGYSKLYPSWPKDMWSERPVLKLGTRSFVSASLALEDAQAR
jgi:hypothetical protein